MKPRSNPFLRSAALVASIVLRFAASAQAGSLTWDGSDTSTPGAQGGNGTWDTSILNWWNGSANIGWPVSGMDNDAVFGGTAGTVSLGSANTANDLTFNTTGYILSGAQTLALNGTTPTITTASGVTTTIGNNTATILAGSAGLTKAGAGTLILNGSAVNTFTGGLGINGGTLALDFANLATPTNLLNSGNALALRGSTLSVTGKNSGATSQTFASTTLNSGASTITLAQNGGTSTTLQLGAITRNVGATLNFSNVPATTGIIVKRGTTATAGFLGAWATVGTGTNLTYASIDASANIVTATAAASPASNTVLITGVATSGWSTDGTKSYQTSGLSALTAARSINLYRSVNGGNTAFSLGDTLGSNFSVNGFMNTGSGVITIQRGTAANYVLAGSALDLVFTGPTGITVSAPIANNGSTAGAGGSASAVTYSGTSTLTLSGANTYTGQTTINSGAMTIGANGSINSSSGIVVNGGTFAQANTATAISPVLSLNNGTVDGTGTINTVNVSDSATARITNGNGGTGALTINNLTFSGDGIIDIRTAGSAGLAVTNTLTTTSANGQVVINVVAAPAWANGSTYNLIGYGTLSGSFGDFTKGTITGLGARQTATLGNAGGFITLGIAGDSALWTGAASGGAWTTNTVGTPFNWKTLAGNADTEFLTNDDVVFNDTATSTSVDITTANVSPNSVIFDNSTKSYTISSSGGYGIASGTVTKNGGNTVSLTAANTYSGSTTVNAGTLEVSGSILNSSAIQINGGTLKASGGNALSNTGLVTLANTAGAAFQVLASETIGALAGGGATGGSVVIDNGQILSLGGGTQTFGGVISGQGGLTVSGAIQTLTGTNTYQGATLISSGTLEIGNGVTDGSLASTSGITTNGTLRLNLAADQNYVVGIDGTGGITKAGAGILTLSGTNSYSGSTSITSGTVKAGSTTALGSNSAVSLANTAGVALDLNGNSLTIGSLSGSGSTGGAVALGSNNLTIKATTNNQTYNGLFTGSGSIIVDATTATNQVNFGGDGTAASGAGYTGNVSVNSGTLQLGKTNNILGTNASTTQTVVIASGAAVNLAYGNAAYTHNQNFVINGTGTAVAGNAALSGTQLGFGNGTIGGLAVASNATIRTTLNTATESRGVNVTRGLVGTGKLTKTGNGYLYLNAAAPSSPVTWAGTSYSGFTGDVDVSAGVIQLANVSHVLGTNTSGTQLVTISSGAAVVLNGGNGAYTANQNFVLNGTGTGQAANLGGLAALQLTDVNFNNEQIRGIAVASNSTISVNRNSTAANTFGLDVNGPLAGTGTLTVTSLNASTSNATLYLKAAAGAVGGYSAFTGNVEIRNGARLASNHATALGTTANVDVADGSVFSIGANQTLGGLTNATTVANTGSVLLNSQTLTVGSTNNLNSTFSGVISNGSGAGGIIKDGTGTLTLTGDNSYTGSTGVTQGTLLISGSGDINQTSGVTISTSGTFRYNSSVAYSGGAITNNGGTIAGSGSIGASVALDSLSDKLAPGNSPGIQNYGTSQTWNAFTYQWETNNFTGTTAGADFDQITVTGSLTLDLAGSYAVDLLSLTALNAGGDVANFSETARQWAILTASGGITNFDVGDWTINAAGFTSSPARTGTFSLSADANNIYLNYALVPEPSGAMLAAVGILGLAARRRRNAA